MSYSCVRSSFDRVVQECLEKHKHCLFYFFCYCNRVCTSIKSPKIVLRSANSCTLIELTLRLTLCLTPRIISYKISTQNAVILETKYRATFRVQEMAF